MGFHNFFYKKLNSIIITRNKKFTTIRKIIYYKIIHFLINTPYKKIFIFKFPCIFWDFICPRNAILVIRRVREDNHFLYYSPPPPRKNSRRHRCFFGSCLTSWEKSACDPKLGNNFRDVSIFQSIIIQLLYFCGADTRGVCVGAMGAWPTVTMSKFF